MKLILRHTPFRGFSSNKLSQVIQHTAQNLKQQQSINYLKYEDIFFRLYTMQLDRQKKIAYNIKTIDSMCMLSQFPCKAIVEHFLATGKAYNEEYTVQTFLRLSRAYKISQADNSSTADFSINRLFFTPAFENLIQEYKYGLRKQHAMSWDNAFLVAECLIDIGFVDYEVFSILVNMVQTRLNKQQRNENEIRPFQIEKKDYYIGKHRNTQQNLSNDPQFQAVLKMLNSHVRSHEVKTNRRKSLIQLQTELNSTQQSQNIYHSILESVSLIQSYNQDLNKLIEGILTVRKQYRRMAELSGTKQILRNPQFNLQLLELEEMLLIKKFISIVDIKSPGRIDNQDIQLRRIEQILISIIEPEGSQQDISSYQISEFLNTSFAQGQNKQAQRLNKLRDIAQYGRGMCTLSRFAQVSRKLYNSPDGRSLISMKWQKTLMLWQKSNVQSPQSRQNLHPQKVFRRTFSDLYRMMKRSYSIFMFTIIEAPLKYKIQFFQSLARLGLHQQLVHLLESQNSAKEKVQAYTNAQYFSLIKILNQVGPKINADHLKKAAVKHLKKLYEQSQFEEKKSLFSMQFCTNAINFMCQNCNVVSADMTSTLQSKDQTQILYENLINRLAQQARYYDQSDNFLTHDHLYEALRVLSMERPGQFKFNDNFFSRFAVNVHDKKQLKEFLYRKNPFNSIVQQMCQEYANSPLNGHYPFIQTGFNAKGELTAVLPCSSDQTSMDGKHANGNINAYIHRVKRQFSISIQPLAINSLLDIDYDKTFQGKQFSFKSKSHISNLLSGLFKRDELNLIQFSSVISNICLVLEKHYKRSYLYALVKFLNTLNQCVRLFDRQKQILSFQLFKFRRYRLFVQLDALKEDYNLIDKSVKEELEKMWKRQTLSPTNQLMRRNASVIGMVETIQQEILDSVNTNNKQSHSLTKTLFQGKRFSIQTFIQNDQKYNIGVQFINPTAYIDKSFCPYNDWAKAINKVYPLETIKLSGSSNTTKILTKRFLPNANQELTLLPFAKKSALKDRPEFTLNSLQPIKNVTQATIKPEPAHTLSQHQLQQAKQLLSFIHELKLSKSQQQLIDYVFSFDFISQIAQKTQKGSMVQPLPREHNCYFNYLQARNNKMYLQSPNLEYLFGKLEQREQIYQIFNNRKQRKAQVKIQYQLGNLSRKEYFGKVQAVDEQVITKLKTLDKNVLDNVEQYRILQNGLKMVRIQKDQKQLQRVLNRARYYERTLDKDFIHVRGNTDKCLKIKRNKAERTLALYRVFYKLSKQTELTQHDKELLSKEASYITYRLENKKEHPESFSQGFTALTVADLSKADRQRLKLAGSDLSQLRNLPITDLILEFNNLLDSKVYENFEKSLAMKHYSSLHGLPEEIFASSLKKQFSKLAHQQQRSLINEHSKMDFYELGLLSEMIQTFKTESKTGKQRFNQLYQAFYEDIQEMNNSQARVELISQYLNQKESEYAQDYNPRLVTEIKQRQAMKLWNVIFKQSYLKCDSKLIRETVNKICQRIRLMGENSPPFFGLLVIKILQHPSTDSLSKQNLISNIQYFKTPLKIDSQDIRSLGFACSGQEKVAYPNSQKTIEQIGLTSNKNFMENLNTKINMVI